MVCAPYPYQRICYFHEVKIGEAFASSKETADYIKLDDISGRRIWKREGKIGLFEEHDLVYIDIHRDDVLY